MPFDLGTEPLREYLAFELAEAARKLVQDVMLTKPGEEVVITADTSSDWRVVVATAQAARASGAVPTVVWYPTSPQAVMEPPAPVAAAVAASQVWIEYAPAYLLHTRAWKDAMQAGSRYICLTGMDVTMMVNTLGRVDFDKLLALGETLRCLVEAADEVRVTSPAGTDLLAYNRGRRVRQSGKRADTPGEPIMLGGQVSWCPLEETIDGKLVFDGALWPPAELGILRSPVELTLEGGVVTGIDGGADAAAFRRWMESFNDPNMFRLAHYSLGFNPGVTRVTGRIAEDERVFGCIEMGLGSQGAQIRGKTWSAVSHTDGIVLNPSIHLDGQPLEIEGAYVHPEVVDACRALKVAGY